MKKYGVDRFKLEDQLMDAWGICEDLEALLDDNMNDDMMNCLIGLKCLYDKKFRKLYETFEHLVHEGNIR